MNYYRTDLKFEFDSGETLKNISEHIQIILEESRIKEGMIVISAQNTTSAVFVNDHEEGLLQDLQELLRQIIPEYKSPQYRHNRSEKDADAHLKSILIGRSVTVSVTEGKMDLGNWEQIFYADFTGVKKKKVCVKIIGE